jgi:hypothetical protein
MRGSAVRCVKDSTFSTVHPTKIPEPIKARLGPVDCSFKLPLQAKFDQDRLKNFFSFLIYFSYLGLTHCQRWALDGHIFNITKRRSYILEMDFQGFPSMDGRS